MLTAFYRFRFALLVIVTLDTLDQLNVVFYPPAQRILRLAARATRAGDKAFL
jgi:hypothetical protein